MEGGWNAVRFRAVKNLSPSNSPFYFYHFALSPAQKKSIQFFHLPFFMFATKNNKARGWEGETFSYRETSFVLIHLHRPKN